MQKEKTKKIREGYKKTEVGIIPEDWELKELSKIISKIIDNRGKTPPYSDIGAHELIETMSISFVTSCPDYKKVTKYISNFTYNNWFRDHPKKDYILISTVGEYSGSSAIMKENKGTIAQNLIALKIGDEIYSDYVFYWTRSKTYHKQLNQVMMNQAQPSLRLPWLLNFKILYPQKKEEQTVIANILSDTDKLIENLEKLIDKKKKIKKGAMQELLTGKRRLPGFSGDWEVKELGETAEIYQPATIAQDKFSDNGYLVYGANGIIGKFKNYNHKKWQTIITCRGSTCGTVNKTVDKCWITGNAMVINIDNNKNIDKLFFYYLLKNQDFSPCITGSGQPQIIRNPLYQFKIFFPTTEKEQTAIANILSSMDKEIESLEKKLDKYKKIKVGMMQQLLTGKIRVYEPAK